MPSKIKQRLQIAQAPDGIWWWRMNVSSYMLHGAKNVAGVWTERDAIAAVKAAGTYEPVVVTWSILRA